MQRGDCKKSQTASLNAMMMMMIIIIIIVIVVVVVVIIIIIIIIISDNSCRLQSLLSIWTISKRREAEAYSDMKQVLTFKEVLHRARMQTLGKGVWDGEGVTVLYHVCSCCPRCGFQFCY